MRNILVSLQVLPKLSDEYLATGNNGLGVAPVSPSADDSAAEVLPVDVEGSARLLAKQHLVSALLSEQFYIVSSKAQRKVPVPDGIRLDAPFDSTALKEFRNETQSKLSLTSAPASWSLVPGRRQMEFESRSEKVEQFVEPSCLERGYPPTEELKNRTVELTAGKSSQVKDDKHGNLFYLRSPTITADVAPLSKVLLETFEDNQKKTKKSKKTGKKSKVAVDLTELQPAGALSSDDEPEHKSGKRGKAASTSKQKVQMKFKMHMVILI